MPNAIKSNISTILQKLLIKISPDAYKKRYLGRYINLSWHNYNEQEMEYEMLLLAYFLNKDSVFFDIGSNIGSYILVANKYIPQKQIYGFEPIPELNERLTTLFPEAHINSTALSSSKTNTRFKIPKINHTHYLTRGTLNTDFKEENEQGYRMIDVQTDTLDNFLSGQNTIKPDLIKIDVEGHEHEVIKGTLKTLIEKRPTLIIEIEQRHHAEDISIIINAVKQCGYSCCYFNSNSFQLKELTVDPQRLQDKSDYGKNKNYIHNFIFISTSQMEKGILQQINEKINNDRKK